ncbi:hypothetical protein Xenpb_02153 [Xenorhabdus sp. PB62.4]|nr:hypothetical protein [Xenorhabdus sp. PB62.4]
MVINLQLIFLEYLIGIWLTKFIKNWLTKINKLSGYNDFTIDNG